MATYSITGTCMYCGQMATLNASEPMEGAAANKYITDHCSCEGARRARRAGEAHGSVDYLFGEDCVRLGFQPESIDVCSILNVLIDEIKDGVLVEVTAKLPSGDTCKIKLDNEGDPQVSRTLKRTRTM